MVKAFPQIIPVMAPYLLEVVVKNPSKNTAKMGPANTPMAVLPSWRTPSRFVVIIASLQTKSNVLIRICINTVRVAHFQQMSITQQLVVP